MENISDDLKAAIEGLKDEDAMVRRNAAETIGFMSNVPETVIKQLTGKLADTDKGVRDAVSFALINLDSPVIGDLVVPFVSSSDISIRNLAGEVLLKKGLSVVDAMLNYIDKGDDDDKKFIIDILGLIGDDKPAQKILEVLHQTENENVVLACIEALGNIKYEPAVTDIIGFYEVSELYAPTIIEALGKIGGKEALDFIMNNYEIVDELTKFSMIESIGLIGDENAFFKLLSDLKNLSGPTAWAAIETLNKLKDSLQLDVPFDEHIKNAVLKTLIEADVRFKRAASNLITVFNDKEVIEVCLKIYGEDAEIDDNIKNKFIENAKVFYTKLPGYLKQNSYNLKQLLDLFKDILQIEGGEALRTVSQIEFYNLLEIFTLNLEHPDEEIRRTCIEMLFYLNPETAFMFIDTIISDNNMWNKMRILEILEYFDDPRGLEAIKKLAEDPEEMVSEKAKYLLQSKQ
jgi:HEAT repeat protein